MARTPGGCKLWSEATFTKYFCKRIEAINGLVFSVVGSSMQQAGWPDRYICHPKWRGWVEFKATKGQLRKLQRKRLQDLYIRGANALVCKVCDIDNSFDLLHVDGRQLLHVDFVPVLSDKVAAGKLFLNSLIIASNTKPHPNSPCSC